MPLRDIPLVNGQIYHLYNRGIDNRTTFKGKRLFRKAIEAIWYYRYVNPPVKLAIFRASGHRGKAEYLAKLEQSPLHAEVLSFVLMPNHYHLIVRQLNDKGISRYMANFQNSYTRLYNQSVSRTGALFDRQFKAVRVEGKDQLQSLSRYLHLNPLLGYVTRTHDDLEQYEWSSYPEYLGTKAKHLCFCNTQTILSHFKDSQDYRLYVKNQKDYQETYPLIQSLTIENES